MEVLLQIIIMICLMVIILLLCMDKVKFIINGKEKVPTKTWHQPPELLGKALSSPVVSTSSKASDTKFTSDHVTQDIGLSDQQAKLYNEENLSDDEDVPPDDDRFSQGVSLKELTKVGTLLQQQNLSSEQEKDAIEIMQKLQGTDLFSMMQESIEGASQKIAKLLHQSFDEHHSYNDGSGKSFDRTDHFDIENFI